MNNECIRRGNTLIEMLITLALLAIIASVSTLAIRRIDTPDPSDPQHMIDDSLRKATSLGASIGVRFVHGETPANAFVGSDGSVVADSVFKMDRLSGRPHAQ